jgi:hypothetical protein
MEVLQGFTVGQSFLIGLATGLSFSAIFAAWLLMTERD